MKLIVGNLFFYTRHTFWGTIDLESAVEGSNDAVEITYDNSTSLLAATNVQAGIDELAAEADLLLNDKLDRDGSISMAGDLNMGNNAVIGVTTIAASGTVTAGSIVTAGTVDGRDVSDLGTDVDDVVTLTGLAANSTDLGTFTGTTITDNTVLTTALQDLEVLSQLVCL